MHSANSELPTFEDWGGGGGQGEEIIFWQEISEEK